MKKMIGFLGMAFLMSAFAVADDFSGPYLTLLKCTDAAPTARSAAIVVTIEKRPPSIHELYRSVLVATVKTLTPVERIIGTYTVEKKQSEALGSPQRYVGKDFELDVKMVAPQPGGVPSSLVFDSREGRFSEDMLCQFTR